jgi:hypothetical protein
MPGSTFTTASTLKAILCYIDAEKTPKIAYDRDDMAIPLIKKVKEALGDRDGSQDVSISFGYGEEELERQFSGVCENIEQIFNDISRYTKQY